MGGSRMEGMTRRTCITLGTVPVIAAAVAYATGESGVLPAGPRPRFRAAGPARAVLPQRHLPNVPLVMRTGDKVRFYDDLVRDKKTVLTFVSSRAPAESRKVTENLAALQSFFGPRIGRDIFLYSIARNPEHDTPAVLRRWAARSGAGPGWRVLTGNPSDVERLRRGLGFVSHDPNEDADPRDRGGVLRRGLGFVSDDPTEDADPRYAVGMLRHGVEREMRWAHCQSQAKARVIAHSMLLDFGPGPADARTRITWNLDGAGARGSAPVWDCQVLLAGLN